MRLKRAGIQDVIEDTKRLRICAIQEKDHNKAIRRPYLLVEVGTEFQTEFALFDTGADVNAMSYEVWERLCKPTLCESKTTLMTFSKETNHVEGYLDLPIYIGNTNVHHRFYVMKPGKANTPVILGQPWQRTYNGVPNWRREGINFEYDHARLFTPFLKDEDFATDTESDDEESIQEPKETATTTTEQEDSAPTQSPTNQTNEKESRPKESSAETCQPKEQARPKETQLKAKNATPHQGIWVPKKTVQAQHGSTQIWIPKRELGEPYDTRPWTQVSKRQQRSRKMMKETTQGAAQSKKAMKRGQQKTNTSCSLWPKYRQIWVKKTLLKAQGKSTYKWVPKQLLNQGTLPAEQPTYKQQRTTKQTWPTRKITEKWNPKGVLTKQGYFEGARYIWMPKDKKGQEAKQATEPKSEIPRQLNKKTKIANKATAFEKGKWVPKEVCNTADCHIEQLPSTSSNQTADALAKTTAIRKSNQPLSGTNPLDVVKQLVFILRTFNSKQVDMKWKQFMASKATGRVSSPAEALGPNLLQDPPLAQH